MTSAVRLGLLRPRQASRHPVIATAEQRVVEFELGKRLTDYELVLRQVGSTNGPWQSIDEYPWPEGATASIADDVLWQQNAPPLTTLFSRTVDPMAAGVRSRMLHFLNLLDARDSSLDDDRLDALLKLSISPTDLWLIVTESDNMMVTDRDITALRGAPDDAAQLDHAFDEIALTAGAR